VAGKGAERGGAKDGDFGKAAAARLGGAWARVRRRLGLRSKKKRRSGFIIPNT